MAVNYTQETAAGLGAGYLRTRYPEQCRFLLSELAEITGQEMPAEEEGQNRPGTAKGSQKTDCSYEEIQRKLSEVCEKTDSRKKKGVYYTPADVVGFLLKQSVLTLYGADQEKDTTSGWEQIPWEDFCFRKTVYDPTCGAGEFLIGALELKLELWMRNRREELAVQNRFGDLELLLSTVCGNDINREAVGAAKVRLFLCVLERLGPEAGKGLGKVLNRCFESRDFVTDPERERRFHLILGNPPYVEDGKSGLNPDVRYGNIYANVLVHGAELLRPGGVMGFVVPLSYMATPRMGRLRERLFTILPEQTIFSYSDRPDCLFVSVHQKLCILIGRKNDGAVQRIRTGNYRYWYRQERAALFLNQETVENPYGNPAFIPKLGTRRDLGIYEAVSRPNGIRTDGICESGVREDRISLLELMTEGSKNGDGTLYLNMRAAFWMKVFLEPRSGGEYRRFDCRDRETAAYVFCLLNSSVFWWYWVCVSDCWHITRKELAGFFAPHRFDGERAEILAGRLTRRLEETKRYVGTRQTQYEYKHRECTEEIHQIDAYVNGLLGLSEEESRYLTEFAYRYRISKGAGYEGH